MLEVWGILAMHLLAVASFASAMAVLVGRWAIVPTWLSSWCWATARRVGGIAAAAAGAVRVRLAMASVGATVTSLRDAIYFPGYEHARPILVLAAWAAALFGAMLVASYRRGTSPGGP